MCFIASAWKASDDIRRSEVGSRVLERAIVLRAEGTRTKTRRRRSAFVRGSKSLALDDSMRKDGRGKVRERDNRRLTEEHQNKEQILLRRLLGFIQHPRQLLQEARHMQGLILELNVLVVDLHQSLNRSSRREDRDRDRLPRRHGSWGDGGTLISWEGVVGRCEFRVLSELSESVESFCFGVRVRGGRVLVGRSVVWVSCSCWTGFHDGGEDHSGEGDW